MPDTTPVVIKEKKVWFKSKTIWFNIITAIVTGAPLLAPALPISAPVMVVINVVGNMILRTWFTDQKLAATQKKADESATLTP